MKLKGVNWFEQNVEKVVLAGVSVIFLGVVAMQFLYEPNKFKVGTSVVTPGEAFGPVARRAEEVKGKMETPVEQLGLPQPPKADIINQFVARQKGSVTPSPMIVALGPGSTVTGAMGDGKVIRGTTKLAPLVIAAPTSVVVASYGATIDPTEAIAHPELKKLLPAEQPMDKRSVSVEAKFDGAAIKAALLRSGDEGASYPTQWWRDQVEILGVRLERQEMGSNGDWSKETVVPLVPGRGVPDLLKNAKTLNDMPEVLSVARIAAEELQRPQSLRTIAGQSWKRPSEMPKLGDAGVSAEVRKLMTEREKLTAEKDRLNRRLQEIDKQSNTPTRNPGSGGGGGGGGKGSGGGGAAPPSGPATDPAKKIADLKRPVEEALKRNEEKMTANENALKAIGFDTTGNPLPPAAPVASDKPLPKTVLDNPSIDVWAHDLTVTPGKAYRYRVRVLLNNPAFGRGAFLTAEQQDLAKSPTIESAPSEWSDPIDVLADKYFFITSATESDPRAASRATAELYQFFYGYYRKASLYLEPGDVLSAPVKLPDPAKLPVYDLTTLAEANPAQPPPSINQPIQGLPQNLQPGGRGNQIDGGGRGKAGAPAAAPQEKAKVELPQNAKPWSGIVRADFDVYLLDVQKLPADSASRALLRVEDGTIIARIPTDDEKAMTYKAVLASAKDGENQGQPIAPAPDKKPANPIDQPGRPGRDAPPPPPPGGGGGGGGGG